MAFICDDCQYIFSKKRSSCPFCGGRVSNNNNSESILLDEGYSWAPGQKSKETTKNAESPNDYFEDLRQSFFDQQEPSAPPSSIPKVAPQVSAPKSTLRKQPNSQTKSSTDSSHRSDYFSQFGNPSSSDDNIPTVEPRIQQTQPPQNQRPDPYEQELQELERQRQRAEQQYRRRAALNSVLNIRWRAIFRLIFIIILVIAAISIWNMRYIIFSSIVNFLISLLPIVLIIWVLWYLIRSLFR